MREGGTFATLERGIKVLVEDVEKLARSGIYARTLREALLSPYDRLELERFLRLDNIYRDLRAITGEDDTTALWAARRKAFEWAWRDVQSIAPFEGKDWGAKNVHADRERLWNVLLNLRSSKRTPDDVHEQIEIGLK